MSKLIILPCLVELCFLSDYEVRKNSGDRIFPGKHNDMQADDIWEWLNKKNATPAPDLFEQA
jgi:hypothetical protein